MEFDWQYNHFYRLVLELHDEKIIGSLHELDGTLIVKEAYKLDRQSVSYGKAGLDNGGFVAIFDDFKASVKQPVVLQNVAQFAKL